VASFQISTLGTLEYQHYLPVLRSQTKMITQPSPTILKLSWWIWVLVEYPALVLHYLEAGVSQLTGEKKIHYRDYVYSGPM
jgi:hypothetical protein